MGTQGDEKGDEKSDEKSDEKGDGKNDELIAQWEPGFNDGINNLFDFDNFYSYLQNCNKKPQTNLFCLLVYRISSNISF